MLSTAPALTPSANTTYVASGPVKRETAKHYRLGLDIGTNSIGWFVVWLEWDGELDRWRARGLGPGGVRVFPDGRDPQSGTSNAVDRRTARGARKRRDRFVDRRKGLMESLVRHGLMPADAKERKALEALDPYELRAKALDGPLPPLTSAARCFISTSDAGSSLIGRPKRKTTTRAPSNRRRPD